MGALGAFWLVIANDWRRERRVARKTIPVTLRRLRTLIQSRLEGAEHAVTQSANFPTRNVGLRFPVEQLYASVNPRISC